MAKTTPSNPPPPPPPATPPMASDLAMTLDVEPRKPLLPIVVTPVDGDVRVVAEYMETVG